MTLFQAFILGLFQGLAEVLPISSSAHLALAPWLFGWPEPGLAFDVALHVGTLVAVLGYFRAEWARLARAAWSVARNLKAETPEEWRAVYIAIATVPGVIAGILLQKQAEQAFRAPVLIAQALIVMGVVLWLVDRFAPRDRNLGAIRAREPHPLGAEVAEHGDERADVQRDVERESGLGPAEEPRREGEMRGARDREELGEALEEAEDEGLEEGHARIRDQLSR